MGTYLSAALQAHFDKTEYSSDHWETVAEFFFWKDSDLSMALEDAKGHINDAMDTLEKRALYNEVLDSLTAEQSDNYRYQVFELHELPNPVKVYDGHISFKYHALLNAALAVKIVTKARIVFWRDQ